MDWIEEIYEKWKSKLKNFTLKRTMMIYLLIAIILIVIAVIMTLEVCEGWKGMIESLYRVEDSGYRYTGDGAFAFFYDGNGDGSVMISTQQAIIMNQKDKRVYEALSIWEGVCIPVYVILGVYLVSILYYKNKLQEPIALLRREMEYILEDDLSFSCYYDSKDEMGDICKTMDGMRKAVLDNRRNMWELMEEQRKLNAAFAHDLRTPLTVIAGYTEMLLEYYPKGKVKEEQMLETVAAIQEQTVRLQTFSETMKEMHGFEMLEVKRKQHTGAELEERIKRFINGLEQGHMQSIELTMQLEKETLSYDEDVVMEVLGNLLSNALRYGRKKIEIRVEQQDNRLYLYVKDDGRGMTKEELYKADSPYYTDKSYTDNGELNNSKKRNVHFGLGLTICKILCKKHGGSLSFANSIEGGTVVCAEFFVM